MAKPSQRAETIVNNHHHDLLPSSQPGKIISPLVPRQIAAAMHPNHDRPRRCLFLAIGRINIQIKTVFVAEIIALAPVLTGGLALWLRTHHRLGEWLNDRIDALKFDRRLPSSVTVRRQRKRNIAEDARALGAHRGRNGTTRGAYRIVRPRPV